METWQYTLQCILRDHATITLQNEKRNEFDIMKFFIDNVHIRKQILLWFCNIECNGTSLKKSKKKSEEFRKEGNRNFKNKKYLLSIKYYTLSLQYAAWDSEEFPLALANRSAALFHLRKYQASIQDIELALQYNYPRSMLYKLYLRAAQCYLKLHQKDFMEESLCKLHQCLENDSLLSNKRGNIEKQINAMLSDAINIDDIVEINRVEYSLPEVAFGKNPKFSSASAALEIKFSAKKGRHVYTNQNIKKGQVLFLEQPFAFVLIDNKYSDTVCAQCCKWKGDVPIPCKCCSSTIYCTEKCRVEAWLTHHQWECFGNQIGIWDQIGIAHLTVRTFLTCCYTKEKNIFSEIQRLATNIDKISTEDMMIYGMSALMMTLYLEKLTNFFKVMNVYQILFMKFDDSNLNVQNLFKLPPEKWTESSIFLFVSGILLRHMLQLICNGHAITRLQMTNVECGKFISEYQTRVATAIYPSASMMNHSCDPNIINSFKDQYLIVKAIKDIPANTEVLNCYGPHYRRMCKKERQIVLQSQYCFKCECKACTQRTLQNFSCKFQTLSCEECNGPTELINSSFLSCLDCEKVFHVNRNFLHQLDEAKKLHDEAQADMYMGNFESALEKAEQCIQIRKEFLNEHHEAVASTYDLLGKISAEMGLWLDSVFYLELSITAIEERFGPDSIEVGNEINKITDVCIQYLHGEANTNTKRYKNTMKKTRRLLKRAQQIFCLNYGPWNDSLCQITEKLECLCPLLKDLNL